MSCWLRVRRRGECRRCGELVGTLAAFTLGYLLARGTVRDLPTLTRAADRLAAGDDTARADVASRGELGDLAAPFNVMADRIAEQKAILVELAVSDPLTGLHNRRSFHAHLEAELEYCAATSPRWRC